MTENTAAMVALRRIARPVQLRTTPGGAGEPATVDTVLKELNRRIELAQEALSAPKEEATERPIDYEFYELRRVTIFKPAEGDFAIANASVGSCGLCGRVVTGMGGDPSMVCLSCGDELLRGNLRFGMGAIET